MARQVRVEDTTAQGVESRQDHMPGVYDRQLLTMDEDTKFSITISLRIINDSHIG